MKSVRLAAVDRELEDSKIWDTPRRAQELGKEKKALDGVVHVLTGLQSSLNDSGELYGLARAEGDDGALRSIETDVAKLEGEIADLEFRRMFHNPMDPQRFLDIQAGSGGTEAQDWAAMLLRMYLRYCERKGYRSRCSRSRRGEVAGIKSATIKVTGDYAYGICAPKPACTGWCARAHSTPTRAATPRSRASSSIPKSTRRSRSRSIRPTCASTPIALRAREASTSTRPTPAVRITHLPTSIVVQCQSDRSQHRNRAEAFAMLKSKLYELELRKRQEEQAKLEDTKTDIGWGHQIRSYVLDQSRIKDLRTHVEVGNTQAVLDGDLDDFIAASLKQGV